MSRKRHRPAPDKTPRSVAAEQGASATSAALGRMPPLFWLLLLAFVCLVPFIGKPFHIDDTLFVWAAEQIRKHPGDFYGFQINWFHTYEPMHQVFQNPPLVCYYIASWSLCFGWSEVALHSAFLIPALAAVWGIYSLAGIYCSRPALATAAAILTPAFLISATSVMCDVTLVAFWVWTVRLFDRGLQKQSPAVLAIAGVLAGLAYLTKFSGLALVPLIIAYAAIRKRRLGWWVLTPLIPLLFAAAYECLTRKLYGHGHLFQASGYALQEGSKPHLSEELVVGIGFGGACFLPLLFYAPLIWARRGWLTIGGAIFAVGLLALPFAPGLAPVLHPKGVTDWPATLQSALFTLSGINLLALAVRSPSPDRQTGSVGAGQGLPRRSFAFAKAGEGMPLVPSPGGEGQGEGEHFWRDPVSLLLFLWVIGVFTFAIGVNWVINARSFLPAAPALAILLARSPLLTAGPARSERGRLRARVILLPALAAFIITLWLTWSDYSVAHSQRAAAEELCAKYRPGTVPSPGGEGKGEGEASTPALDGQTGSVLDGRTGSVWFEGHWGFQYYMEKFGAKPLDMLHPQARRSDIIIIPNFGSGVARPAPTVATLIDSSQYLPNKFVSTLNPPAGACFYASSWGPLPFIVAPLKPDYYLIFRHSGP